MLALRPNDAQAHEFMGGILVETKRAEQGIAEFKRALALDPNLANAHGLLGLAKVFVGHPEETEAHENEALRLSPRDSFAWLWLHFEGAAKVSLGREEEAVDCFAAPSRSTRMNPLTHFFLAATLANLGKLEEARAEAKSWPQAQPPLLDRSLSQRRRRFSERRQLSRSAGMMIDRRRLQFANVQPL